MYLVHLPLRAEGALRGPALLGRLNFSYFGPTARLLQDNRVVHKYIRTSNTHVSSSTFLTAST